MCYDLVFSMDISTVQGSGWMLDDTAMTKVQVEKLLARCEHEIYYLVYRLPVSERLVIFNDVI